MIALSRLPEKWTLVSLEACISLGNKSGNYTHCYNGPLQAQYTNLFTPVPLASKSAGVSSI